MAAAPKIAVPRTAKALNPMPRLRAKVVHGFGRGSKTLGFPTANMEVRWDKESDAQALEPHEQEILKFAQTCEPGIYYAWAQVADGKDRGVYKVAMSVGWNPTFTDVKAKTIEPWILHDYEEDFYDCELRLIVCGFVRPELKFDDFGELITAIKEDGDFCNTQLDADDCRKLLQDSHFVDTKAKVAASSTTGKLVVDRAAKTLNPMPRLRAKVVHGFGRGSKTLGFPTANMEVRWDMESNVQALNPQEQEILKFAQSCEPGIYYAWAQVADGKDRGVYKVAMSVGWNPTFTDVKAKTIEPWILHDYEEDFYDCELRLIVCGFVRPELKFDDFGDLITAIREDGDFCDAQLDADDCRKLLQDSHFAG